VAHCHFKSNQHLDDALEGRTDLDVLIDRRAARVAQTTFLTNGFKRFSPKFGADYPAVEDYIGMSQESASIVHFHVHYALLVGEVRLKSYQLELADTLLDINHYRFDLGDAILESRVRDPRSGIYVVDPSFEMHLLLTRLAFKLRWRNHLLEVLGARYVRGEGLKEYEWLLERADPLAVSAIAQREGGERAGKEILKSLEGFPTTWALRGYRSSVRKRLSWQRTFSRFEIIPLRILREIAWVLSVLNRRFLRLPIAFRRVNPTGGRIVALLGADGSGKTTIVREIDKWLAWKIDIYPVYLGSGAGRASPLRIPMIWVLRILTALGKRGPKRPAPEETDSSTETDTPASMSDASRRVTLPRALWAIALAIEKRAKMHAVVRARNRGMVVVCDRYPQAMVLGINDGPLLHSWLSDSHFLRRRLAEWELRSYQRMATVQPDLVIKLHVDPSVSLARKTDMSLQQLGERVRIVRALDYGPGCMHLDVDASAPLEEVLLTVRRSIWNVM
jgi:thymidylate kinase